MILLQESYIHLYYIRAIENKESLNTGIDIYTYMI